MQDGGTSPLQGTGMLDYIYDSLALFDNFHWVPLPYRGTVLQE
jgi:hypothetical protein